MLETTRRGLFSYLAAALAWLIGRRTIAASTTTDAGKDPGLAGPATPQAANVPTPTPKTTVYSFVAVDTPSDALTLTLVYDATGTTICRSGGSSTTFTYDADGR